VEHLELAQIVLVTGLIRMRKTSDTKVSPQKELHNKLKIRVQAKKIWKIGREKKNMQRSNFRRKKRLGLHL
jgi:hypothetical protein